MSAEKPFLALLPGFDGTGELFAPLISQLADSCDHVVVDYGDLATLDDYLTRAESSIPAGRPVHLVAESFSGPIALMMLHRGQRDYRGAVLSTTFAKPPLGLVLSLAQKLRLASFVMPAVSEQILRVFCLNGVSDIATIRATVDVVRQLPQRYIASRLRALTQMDASALLDDIDVPVTVLSANQDRLIRQRFSSSLLQRISDVEHVRIDGPHLLLQAAPQRCATAIRELTGRA